MIYVLRVETIVELSSVRVVKLSYGNASGKTRTAFGVAHLGDDYQPIGREYATLTEATRAARTENLTKCGN